VTRSALLAIGITLAGAGAAPGQIIDGSRMGATRDPVAWTSLSIGWLRQGALCDPDSNACWSFGGAPQWRGTLEYPLGRGATVGVAATRARVPLIYQGGPAGNSCGGCDADANITQYFGNFRLGGGTGIHQVIDVSAGMTVFSGFRSTAGAQLGGAAVSDLSFSIGYGMGYGFSARTQAMIVQEYGLVIHKRTPGVADNTAQQSVTRIGIRYGLGEKRR
jgi:hypothetical protein